MCVRIIDQWKQTKSWKKRKYWLFFFLFIFQQYKFYIKLIEILAFCLHEIGWICLCHCLSSFCRSGFALLWLRVCVYVCGSFLFQHRYFYVVIINKKQMFVVRSLTCISKNAEVSESKRFVHLRHSPNRAQYCVFVAWLWVYYYLIWVCESVLDILIQTMWSYW